MGIVQNLTHEEAFLLLNTAYQLLSEDGKTASIFIAERNGTIIAQLNMDDIRPVTANIAMLKAKQSACTAERTGWLRDAVSAEEYSLELFNVPKSEYVPWAGGVPIYSSDHVLLGGIGICNLDETEDEYYAVKTVENCGFLSNRT
jgi:glc operon protein GlcG